MKMKVQDSCHAMICWDDKVLLFLRDDTPAIPSPDCWELPGGGMKDNEKPDNCIVRELIEEVSYSPQNLKYQQRVQRPDGGWTNLYWAFVDEDEAKKFKLGKFEGQDVAFFTLEEMKKLKLTPGVEYYFDKYESELTKALAQKTFANFPPNPTRE